MNRKNLVLGMLVTLAVIIFVALSMDWTEVIHILRSVNLRYLLLALAIYVINYIFRTFRFQVLLGLDDIPIYKLFGLTSLYGMYLYLMPAKFGELSFPILVKRHLGIDISESTATLISVRIFDFLTVTIFLLMGMIFYWDILSPNILIPSLIFCGAVLFVFILFVRLLRNPDRIDSLLERISTTSGILQKIGKFLGEVFESSRKIEKSNLYSQLFLLTVAVWICVNSNFYLITRSLNYRIDFFQIVFISIIMIPLTLFPIQGFANLGAHEIGWVAAFTLFDYPYNSALNIALSSHIIQLLFVLFLGVSGLMFISIGKKFPRLE